MKNKILFFIVSCLLNLAVGLFGTFLYFQSEENNMELSHKQGILFIKGCQVENTNVIVYKDYAILPFLKILSAFDYKIQWISDTEVNITNSHGAYILNIKEKTLLEENPILYNFNLLIPPPGSIHYYCEVKDKEILIDQSTVVVIMKLMNKNIKISSDFDNAIVSVTERENFIQTFEH